MNYKAGDDVVCVDSQPHFDDSRNSLVAGHVYRVFAMAHCLCGRRTVNVGVDSDVGMVCLKCGEPAHEFRASRFIKLNGLTETQTERDEVTA